MTSRIALCLGVIATLAISFGSLRQDPTKSVGVVPKTGPLQGITTYTDSYALFIGIGKYENPQIPLIPSAPNDAKTMRDILTRDFGFNPSHVQVLTDQDATKRNIERAIGKLCDRKQIKPTDRVLVFISCHGQGVPLPSGKEIGYLIPYDAEVDLNDLSNVSGFQTSCLKMDELTDKLEASPARHRAVIVDACFSGFSASSKALGSTHFEPEALKKLLNERGLFVMAAGSTKEEAAGSRSTTGLSLYTQALVNTLKEANIQGGTYTAGQLFAESSAKTLNMSKGKQNPQSDLRDGVGQMVFFSATVAPIVDPQPGVIKKLATIAGLSVTVTPSDARIEVDGQAVSASSSVTTEPGGKRKVKLVVSKSGYDTQGFEVELTAGETVPINIELKALPGPVSGGTKGRSKRGNIEMITIPAGNFTLGDNDTEANAKPAHEVFLDSYTISKNLITVAQFKTYCSDAEIDFNKFTKPAWGWIDNHPMVNVNWDEARAYCIWAGGDLPTEAQWEKAARGTDGRKYPWGNEFDASKLWSSVGEARKSTAPVGSFASGASPFGCLDMAGNVDQWCLDWYDKGYSPLANQRNPTGPGFGTYRVMRGGSWYFNIPGFFRSSVRDILDPTYRFYALGFRLCGSL